MKPKTWLFPGTIAGWRADTPITPKVVVLGHSTLLDPAPGLKFRAREHVASANRRRRRCLSLATSGMGGALCRPLLSHGGDE